MSGIWQLCRWPEGLQLQFLLSGELIRHTVRNCYATHILGGMIQDMYITDIEPPSNFRQALALIGDQDDRTTRSLVGTR